jgi:hypothetical protein
MGSIRDFFDDVGDALVPKEIAPYLGVIAPMIPGIGIMGTMALSQLGSMKMNAGKLDPYAAAAAAISLSTPEQKALRAAGKIDPSKGTVGQKLSAGIGNFFGGADTRLGRAFDPTRSMFQFTSGGKGSYFENPIMAGLDTGAFGYSKLPDAIKNNPTLAEFVKNKGPMTGSESVSDFAKQNFDTVAQETYDLKYGKPLTAAEVKDEVGEEVYNKMTADELKAAQEAGRTGGTIDDSFLQQAGEMGSQLAGEIIPGFRDLDPVTGAVTSKFNFGKALQTVSVAGTLGSLNMLAEELKKQKQLDEQKQREIWSTWFDSYQRTTGRSYDQSMYPDPILLEKFNRFMLATGGRVGYNMGGLSGGIMGSSGVPEGMQVDGRNGTFIPMGVQEKADDVPAMLSKNEFVMTADAVKAAGDGDANKGAQRMYDLMHNLEAQV